jgi:hypothetical protein
VLSNPSIEKEEMMGQQEMVTGTALRRIIMVLTVVALLVVMAVAPAFAAPSPGTPGACIQPLVKGGEFGKDTGVVIRNVCQVGKGTS